MTPSRRSSILAASGLAALVLVASSSASVPFWWWSTAKANRMVVWSNPQIGSSGHTTTALEATCVGEGAKRKTAAGRPLFHVFRCDVVFRDDDTGAIGRRPLRICSSKRTPDRVLRYGLGVPGCP